MRRWVTAIIAMAIIGCSGSDGRDDSPQGQKHECADQSDCATGEHCIKYRYIRCTKPSDKCAEGEEPGEDCGQQGTGATYQCLPGKGGKSEVCGTQAKCVSARSCDGFTKDDPWSCEYVDTPSSRYPYAETWKCAECVDSDDCRGRGVCQRGRCVR